MDVGPRLRHETVWKAPLSGMVKINFDGAKLGSHGRGWSAVIRDCDGVIRLAAVQQGQRFVGPELEEARACLFAMQQVWDNGFRSIVMEGDSLSIVTKLKNKTTPNTELGNFISHILVFSRRFVFCAFTHVKREGNRVAHNLAHLQPYEYAVRSWVWDGPDRVYDLANQDLCMVSISE